MNTDLELLDQTEITRTYKLNETDIHGFTNDLDALKQAIYKTLNTEKYEHPIYSFNYGIEIENLFGKDSTYVSIELKRRIKECLLRDARIRNVGNFKITVQGDRIECVFDVESVYGKVEGVRFNV